MKHTPHFFRHFPGLTWLALTLALAAAFLTADKARAAEYYWDEDGATAGFGTASGTWLNPTPGGTVGWSTDATGASAIGSVTTATADTLYFGTDTAGLATGTVTVGAAVVNVGNLYFGKASGDITLTGGDIAMAGGGNSIRASSSGGSISNTFTVNNDLSKTSGSLTFGRQNTANEHIVMNGVLSGGFDLSSRMVNGSGLLELNGLNTFSGNVGIVTGQVNANTFADSGTASALGAGGTISMGGGGGQQPRLVYTGASATSTNRTLRINTASGGAGGIIAQAGAVDFSGNLQGVGSNLDNLLLLSGTADTGINTVSGVIMDNNGVDTGQLDVRIQSLGAVGVTGEAGYWIFSGPNTYTGTTSIQNSSTLQLGDGGTTGSLSTSSAITVDAGSTFVVNQSDTVTQGTNFSSTLSGAGDVTMAGAGTLEMLIQGGYTGATHVDSGTLRLVNTADTAGMASKSMNINNGSTLEIFSDVGGANRTNFLNSTTFTFDSNGGGTIVFDKGNHLNQGNGATFVTTGGAKNIISTVNGGYINSQNTGKVTFDVADGSDAVDLQMSVPVNSGNYIKNGAGTLSITSFSSLGGGGTLGQITINDGTFEIGGNGQLKTNGAGAGVVSSPIVNDGVFKHNSTADQTVSGEISGTGALEKDNTGTLTLSGANSYDGNTTVSAGTVSLGDGTSNTTLSDTADVSVATGAVLNLNYAGTDTVAELFLGGAGMPTGTWGATGSGATHIDDTHFTGAGTLTVSTAGIYGTWAAAKSLTGADALTTADIESPTPDGMTNLLEFAFGTDPKVSDNNSLTVTDGTTFTPGQPVVEEIFSGGNPVKLRYVRRKDHVTAGLTYTPKFTDSTGTTIPDPASPTPTVVSDAGGDYEVVEVPFPLFDSTGKKPTALIAVVEVTLN